MWLGEKRGKLGSGCMTQPKLKKMNKEGEFLEKCGFSSGLAWCTVLKAVDLKMLRQEFVIVAIKRQMKFTFFKRNCGAANSKKFFKHSPLVRDS